MAKYIDTTYEAMVDRLSVSMKGELQRLILEKLNKTIQPMMEDIAKEMAHNLYASITTVRDPLVSGVKVLLRIDGVNKLEIPERPPV